MKKQNLKKMLNLRSFALIAILSVAVFATSCNKADDGYIPSESEMMLKKGKPADAGKPDDVPRAAPAPGDKTIAEIVVAAANPEDPEVLAPEFTLLLAALQYAGLTEVFAGEDQFTVFAPTDQAFVNLVENLGLVSDNPFKGIDEKLGEGTVANVLLYHVTEGRRAANSVVPPMRDRTITTLLGSTFTVNSGGVITDIAGQEVNIVAADISASNGIIHVIDTVLLPLE